MPEEQVIDPAADPAETGKEAEAGKEEGKATLEGIVKQNKELNEKLEKVLKQNSDKDAFITKLEGENKEVRGTLEKLSTTLQGKTEKQRDALIDTQRQKFLAKGYDEETVDLILDSVSEIAEKKASKSIAPIITDAAMELIENDTEIDKDFIKSNEKEIMDEYHTYKIEEMTPRKLKSNFKKAYKQVHDRLADKAKSQRKDKDSEERNNMTKGAGDAGKGGKNETSEHDSFVEGIVSSGSGNSRFS